MIPAHISRLLTFTEHGMPKAYGDSAMMKQDIEWLLRDYRMQTGDVLDLREKVELLKKNKPLTYEQIDEITGACFDDHAWRGTTALNRAVVRAVESAHGIKG